MTGVPLIEIQGLEAGDYMLAGNEVMRISDTPLMPDADVTMEGFNGQRRAYLGTSPEGHASDQPVYKAQLLPEEQQLLTAATRKLLQYDSQTVMKTAAADR